MGNDLPKIKSIALRTFERGSGGDGTATAPVAVSVPSDVRELQEKCNMECVMSWNLSFNGWKWMTILTAAGVPFSTLTPKRWHSVARASPLLALGVVGIFLDDAIGKDECKTVCSGERLKALAAGAALNPRLAAGKSLTGKPPLTASTPTTSQPLAVPTDNKK